MGIRMLTLYDTDKECKSKGVRLSQQLLYSRSGSEHRVAELVPLRAPENGPRG